MTILNRLCLGYYLGKFYKHLDFFFTLTSGHTGYGQRGHGGIEHEVAMVDEDRTYFEEAEIRTIELLLRKVVSIQSSLRKRFDKSSRAAATASLSFILSSSYTRVGTLNKNANPRLIHNRG